MKIAMLTGSFERGGAETQLRLLAGGLVRRGDHVSVLSMYGGGAGKAALQSAGVCVRDLHKRGRWDVARFFWGLDRELAQLRPDVIYSWLPTPNLIGAGWAKSTGSGAGLVWAVRGSWSDARDFEPFVRATAWLEARVASVADAVVVNSRAGVDAARARGFPAQRIVRIANAVDLTLFRPDERAGAAVRREWRIPHDIPLVGAVCRLDPVKSLETFVRAAAALRTRRPETRFVCVGDGSRDYRQALRSEAAALGLGDTLLWAGTRGDMHAVYNALDVLCLPSTFEGFPNVIGEAMATGVPAVATPAGDTVELVGDDGCIVPIGDADAMARGIDDVLDRLNSENTHLRKRLRERAIDLLSSERMVRQTRAVLTVAARRRSAERPGFRSVLL